MIIYIISAIFISCITILDIFKIRQPLRIGMLLISYFLLALFAGLRYNTGPDYMPYMQMFDDVSGFWNVLEGTSNFADIPAEPGYLLFNSLIKSIFGDAAFLFLYMALFGLGFIFYSTYKYSPFAMISIFIYFTRFYYLRDMGQIRTAMASAIMLFSISAIAERQFWRFIGLLVLASSFHKAALIFLPIYFIGSGQLKKKFYYYGIIISYIIAATVPFKELITVYFLGNENNVLVDYALSVYGEDLGIFNPVGLMQALLLCLFVYFKEKLEKKIRTFNVVLNIYAISTYWLIIFSSLGIIAGRIGNMLATVEIILIPSLLLSTNSRLVKVIIYISILTFGLTYLYFRFTEKGLYDVMVPYKSIF